MVSRARLQRPPACLCGAGLPVPGDAQLRRLRQGNQNDERLGHEIVGAALQIFRSPLSVGSSLPRGGHIRDKLFHARHVLAAHRRGLADQRMSGEHALDLSSSIQPRASPHRFAPEIRAPSGRNHPIASTITRAGCVAERMRDDFSAVVAALFTQPRATPAPPRHLADQARRHQLMVLISTYTSMPSIGRPSRAVHRLAWSPIVAQTVISVGHRHSRSADQVPSAAERSRTASPATISVVRSARVSAAAA